MRESTKKLGKINFDPQTGLYCAEVLTVSAMETFQTEDIDELRRLLRKALRDSLETPPPPAIRLSPGQPGETILLCLEPALYQQLSQQASSAGKNLNQYIVDILREVVDHAPLAAVV